MLCSISCFLCISQQSSNLFSGFISGAEDWATVLRIVGNLVCHLENPVRVLGGISQVSEKAQSPILPSAFIHEAWQF